MATIAYLTHGQIDQQKWDACIDDAGNGLIYAYSVYLNSMAKNWDALVLNDYEAVMPLTWNRKYRIHYLYQPPFTACLGVFGKNINAETVAAFLEAVPAKFSYWDIYFNSGNLFPVQGYNLYQRMNYVLNLNSNYETLFNAYRENTRRNIKRSEQYGLVVTRNAGVTDAVELAKKQAGEYASIPAGDFANFTKLYAALYKKEKATTYAVHSKEGRLLAAAVFFFSHHRAYYILVGNHPDGKTLGASHALINAFIKDHAGEQWLLDFEGSDIPGLAHFYSSFGAAEEKYSAIRLNRLPVWMRWMKK